MSDTITAWHDRQNRLSSHQSESKDIKSKVNDKRAYQILLEYSSDEIKRALEILNKTK